MLLLLLLLPLVWLLLSLLLSLRLLPLLLLLLSLLLLKLKHYATMLTQATTHHKRVMSLAASGARNALRASYHSARLLYKAT